MAFRVLRKVPRIPFLVAIGSAVGRVYRERGQ